MVNLLVFCEPLRGRRWVDVTEHRTKVDLAHQIKQLVDERYPKADLASSLYGTGGYASDDAEFVLDW